MPNYCNNTSATDREAVFYFSDADGLCFCFVDFSDQSDAASHIALPTGRLASLVGKRFAAGGLVLFFYHPKKGKRRKLQWLNTFSCKQWGSRSLNNYQPWS